MRDRSHGANDTGVPSPRAGLRATASPGFASRQCPGSRLKCLKEMALPEGFEPSYQP